MLKFIPTETHCSLYVRKLSQTSYESIVAALEAGEKLYAIFDVLKSAEDFMVEKAQIERLQPGELGYGLTPRILKTVFMRIDSKEEFVSQPWINSGWVWFYAVPEWLLKEVQE